MSDWTFGAHVIKGGGLMSGMLIVLSLKEIAHHFRELTELLSGYKFYPTLISFSFCARSGAHTGSRAQISEVSLN